MVHFEYYAHSCFLFHLAGTRLLIDPYSPEIGHKVPERGADYCWVSHQHFDHSHTAAVSGRTTLIRGCAPRQVGPARAYGVLACHDPHDGANKGHVNLLCLEHLGIHMVHLSDLGHMLETEQLQEIGNCDVVMIPVGGGDCTLDAAMACQVLQQLKPRLIVPMHYRTPFLKRERFPTLESLEPFLDKARSLYKIEKVREGVVRLESLPAQPTVLVIPHLY